MLHLIPAHEASRYPDLIDGMHVLRAQSFHVRRGWRVIVKNGRERDGFDDLEPLYVIAATDAGQVIGSLRLLPTTGPYMMADVFPDVAGPGGAPRDPLIWESSRFCVDTTAAHTYHPDGTNYVTREILAGAISTAQEASVVNIVSVYDLLVERVLKRAGCAFSRLGPVVAYDAGLKTTSGIFDVSTAALAQLFPRTV